MFLIIYQFNMSDNHPTTPSNEPAALEPKHDGNDIKWYDKRLMIPSFITLLIFSVIFYNLAMRHKPPEGHVFPRAPVIRGEYKCCEAGGRYSASWVGNIPVNCMGFGYHSIGTNRNDCGFKEQLNGHTVGVVRAYIPSAWENSPIVVKITAYGQTYYEVTDQQIRERWISGSTYGAVLLAFILTLIAHFAIQVYLIYFHKPPSSKGAQ